MPAVGISFATTNEKVYSVVALDSVDAYVRATLVSAPAIVFVTLGCGVPVYCESPYPPSANAKKVKKLEGVVLDGFVIVPTVKEIVSALVALPPVMVVSVARSVLLESRVRASASSLETAVHVEMLDGSVTSVGNAIVM